MKIYYITHLLSLSNSGVTNKMKSLTSAFAENGHEIIWVIISKQGASAEIKDIANIKLITCPGKDYSTPLTDYLEKQPSEAVYFFRYPMSSRVLFKVCERMPRKIVFEHNTKEPKEFTLRLRSYTFRDYFYLLRHGKLFSVFEELQALLSEWIWATRVLKLSAGGISVTREIAEFEKNRSQGYTCEVVGNGINCGAFRESVRPEYTSKTLHILMICSLPSSWHGADRLIKGLINYKGDLSVNLHMVGRFKNSNYKLAKKVGLRHSANFYGYLNQEALNGIKSKCHIGIGSLGLHRIPLAEGSVLKVREYLASGMPVAIGYYDEDVMQSPLSEYCLRFDSDETDVDIERLNTFVASVYSRPESFATIKAHAKAVLDFSAKTRKYVEYFRKIAG